MTAVVCFVTRDVWCGGDDDDDDDSDIDKDDYDGCLVNECACLAYVYVFVCIDVFMFVYGLCLFVLLICFDVAGSYTPTQLPTSVTCSNPSSVWGDVSGNIYAACDVSRTIVHASMCIFVLFGWMSLCVVQMHMYVVLMMFVRTTG